LALAGYYFFNGNIMLASGCAIIAAVGPFIQPAYLFGPLLEGKRAFRQNALSGIILNLVPTVMLLGIMLFTDSPLVFLAAYLGASVLTSLGPVNLAVYSFAVSIPDQMKAVIGNLETLAFPKFAQRAVEEVMPTLGRRLLGFTGLITIMVVLYVAAAPYVFQLLFPTYMESVFFSQLYALSLIPIGSVVPVSLLQAHSAKRELYIYNTVIPVFQIASLMGGIALFGLLGAIVARIMTRFITLVTSMMLLRSYARTPH
jgi:hypothetical protein